MAESLSKQVLRENQGVLDIMLNHRFVVDIKSGQLSDGILGQYLVFEHRFVETAVSIYGFAIAKATGIQRKCRLISMADQLANEQIRYFNDAFSRLGLAAKTRDADDPRVQAFCDVMLQNAEHGTYADIIAAMFAAEWMYLTWSRAALAQGIANITVRDWVSLHTTAQFAEQVEWLQNELDEAAKSGDAEQRTKLSRIFGQTQQLEIAFHDAAYGNAPASPSNRV